MKTAPPTSSPLAPETPPALTPHTLRVAGHDITVFAESGPLFEAMLRDIVAAQKRVWVETYIFYNDDSGLRIAEALKGRARAGLDVRVIYDAFGSVSTPASFFTDMLAAGVKVHAYHTFLEGFRRLKPLTILNRRDHRKIMVIDDTSAYFGGMNIVDNAENVHQLRQANRPHSSGWRDVHLRLAGPQQHELADSFERSWVRRDGPLALRQRRSKLPRARLVQVTGEPDQQEAIHFFDSGPGRYSRAARIYTWLIRRARHQISLSMAYFIPVGATLRALLAARKRRVGIRVVVPGKSDVRIVQYATAYLYDRLIKRGFRIYERRHRMLHSKVMVIDDLYTLVGSANLDPRSLTTNLEFIAVIRSQALARVMQRICRFEISQSQRITMEACRRVSAWQRLLNRLSWLVRWWL